MTICGLNIYSYTSSVCNIAIYYSDSTCENLHFDISQRAFDLITSGSDMRETCTKPSVESDPEGVQHS